MCAGKYTLIGQASTSGAIYLVIWDRMSYWPGANWAWWVAVWDSGTCLSLFPKWQDHKHAITSQCLRGCYDWTQLLMLVWQTLRSIIYLLLAKYYGSTTCLSTEEWMTRSTKKMNERTARGQAEWPSPCFRTQKTGKLCIFSALSKFSITVFFIQTLPDLIDVITPICMDQRQKGSSC